MGKKKVLFILPSSVGGAERVTVTISRYLNPSVYDVRYVILSKQVGNVRDILPDGATVIHVKIRNIWDFTITKLVNLLRQERPDFVFSSLRYLNPRVIVAAKIVGDIKIIVRNDNGLKTARWDNKLLMRLTYRWANVVIAQQEEMRQELLQVMKLPGDLVVVINNPLNTEAIDASANAPSPYPDQIGMKYLWVARFFYNKGQDLVCRAFHEVYQSIPDAHLYLLGRYDDKDPYYIQVRQYVEEHHLSEHIHFMGEESNPFPWMRHCDCFVMPSRYEGTPNSLIEAMYVGCPIVATRCIPMIDRMVQDRYNGILVPSEDIPAMSQAMMEAPKLKNFQMTYHPGCKEDYLPLFQC